MLSVHHVGLLIHSQKTLFYGLPGIISSCYRLCASEQGYVIGCLHICIREYGSTLYVGLAHAVSPTDTNFQLTFLLTRLQEALYEDLAV